jgi:predicted TIM-barrel fold metal-dependent hydrolase
VGSERVLFGTDVPFDMADSSARRLADRMPSGVAAKVLGENALRAYGISAAQDA